MNTNPSVYLGTTALALLLSVPQIALAQGREYQRPGALPSVPAGSVLPANGPVFVPQRAVPIQSGAIERGSRPEPVYITNGGGSNFSGNAPQRYEVPAPQRYDGAVPQGYGPVVILPEAPPLGMPTGRYETHRSTYPYSNRNNGNGSGTSPDYAAGNYLPPVGPANGFFNNLTPPIGPANGFGQPQPVQDRRHRGTWYGGSNYVYGSVNPYPVIVDAPPLLGGYYYGGYTDGYVPDYTCPSVYSVYSGFPQYLYSPGVVVVSQPDVPVYTTPYLPFYAPTYQTIYNNNTYYVGSAARADDMEAGGERAKEALPDAYPANSFQAAFADIAQAWTGDNLTLLRRHLRDKDTRISVSLNKKYSYSIASGDFSEITRDALDRLQTVSFEFTRLRKAKNGDVTAYGTHVYRVTDSTSTSSSGSTGASDTDSSNTGSSDSGTVPFDAPGTVTNASPYNPANDPASGTEKTVYVSYTLRRSDGEWYIVAIDSADHDLADTKHP